MASVMCISFSTCNCERCDGVGKWHPLCVLASLLVIVNDEMEWVKASVMCISFSTCNCERCNVVGKGHPLCVLTFLLVIVNDVMEWVKGIHYVY